MQALLYNASAGSGKTYRLARKYVRDVIEEPLRYRHILAVTFTNKATEEMKSRILREVDTLARGAQSPYMEWLKEELRLNEDTIRARAKSARGYILHDYSRFTVLTIDKFFQRILRAFIQELGLDLNYNIELESASILDISTDSLIEQITFDDALRKWLTEFVEERVDDGRRWDIRDGILALSREILKESNRSTLQNAPSKEHIKECVMHAVESSKKSREEYAALGASAVDIIDKYNLSPADFKGASRSFAFQFAKIAGGDIKPLTKSFRSKDISTEGWCVKGSKGEVAVGELLPILRDVCAHYDRDVKLWNTALLLKENYRGFALLGDLYARVKGVCEEQGVMLLSETKLILSEFIKDNDAPFIYEKSGNRFDRFMIDEFQDTSLKEWQNFLPLLNNAISQSEDSTVLVVGDIKQSIYRWRGGDWRILHTQAKADLGEERCEVSTMSDNYRSLPQVVEFNNDLIESVVECENNYLNSLLEEGGVSSSMRKELHNMLRDAYALHAQTPHKESKSRGYVEVSTYLETPPLEERIKDIIDCGYSPSDIMILTRSNSEGVKVANMLLSFKESNEDPRYRFDIMTREALEVGFSPVSRFIIANMKLSLNEADLSQLAIYNSFLGRENFDTPLSNDEREMFRRIRLSSLEECFEQIVMYHRLELNRDNIAYLQALHSQLLNYASSRIADVMLFVEWWEQKGAQESLSVERSDYSIEITTIHKAKGLERKVVIIPFCNWSLTPLAVGTTVWAQGEGEVAGLGRFPVPFKSAMRESQFADDYLREMVYSHIDNVNLLYVALTRAMESLHIFIPSSKSTLEGKSSNSRIGGVILGAIPPSAQRTEHSQGVTYTLGQPSAPSLKGESASKEQLHIMDRYTTEECDLRLRLPSARYDKEDEGFTARHLGVLMHKIFEEITSAEDIPTRLNSMLRNGYISTEEYTTLEQNLTQALQNPLVREWFSQEWEQVRRESDIIPPQGGDIKRPDRVMMRGERAVVVDYKFGQKRPSHYKKQLREYMTLLSQMGYKNVEGYLWYIRQGEIIEV